MSQPMMGGGQADMTDGQCETALQDLLAGLDAAQVRELADMAEAMHAEAGGAT